MAAQVKPPGTKGRKEYEGTKEIYIETRELDVPEQAPRRNSSAFSCPPPKHPSELVEKPQPAVKPIQVPKTVVPPDTEVLHLPIDHKDHKEKEPKEESKKTDLKPPKAQGRRGSFNPQEKKVADEDAEWDWDRTSTPLKPRGKEAKFVAKPQDKFSGFEKENIFVILEIFGNPLPKVEWFKGFKDLSMEGGRFKRWTDGETNSVILGIENLKQEDEGLYKCILNNGHKEVTHEFNLYVSVEGGMDFRAMLLKRKKPKKKVVVEKFEWIEEPIDKKVKQGHCEEASFTCKLSHKGKKAKWYVRNQVQIKGAIQTENGMECYKGDKYSFKVEDDVFTLYIKDPVVADSGRYSCVVKECNDLTTRAYLEVEPPDPEFGFEKKLDKKKHAKTKRKAKLKCKTDNPDAKVKWYKNGKEIKKSDLHYLIKSEGGEQSLEIKEAEIEDSGTYVCKIEEFGKEGESETDCELIVGEFQHKFTSQLQSKECVEDDQVVFTIDVEEDDADVEWMKDGVPIVADGKRVQIVKDGKKRKLIINGAKLDDAGKITAQTNADSSDADLAVKYNNQFGKGLPQFKQCVEREKAVFDVEIRDPNAPVEFFINGEKVVPDGDRIEVLNLGNGKHQLVLNKVIMPDSGTITAKTPSNKGDEVVESKCNFTVAKGEEAPVMGSVDPVTGVAKMQCNMTIPYKIEGEKQSDVEIYVEKDGKLLKIGKDINLTLHGDRVQLDVINPKREKSGDYKVVMKNAQGQDEQIIRVNIMDVPTPPQSVRVSDVFQDNCVVHWSPPKDNGGTDIKKYIVEALDTTTGTGAWTEVAQTPGGNDRSIKVDHLTPNHKYRFRVRAANKIGASDPAEMSGDDILMRDPWDIPDTCGQPDITDWGPDFCDMAWAPPASDGGAEITEYIIEMKEKNMNHWVEGQKISAKDVQFDGSGKIKGVQKGLVEGCEYQFRVRAVNKGGKSLPGPPSSPMIAKTRYLPPHLKGEGIKDITLKKGRPIRYDIWFGGEPPPTVEWFRNGRSLGSDKNMSIELYSKNAIYTEKNTVLSIPRADRARDTGTYTIKLKSEAGQFEASAQVNVLDVPSKPKLLMPTEVRAEHISLSWSPPDDDGGTPITSYLVRYMDIDTGEWVTACSTGGCSATAKGLKPGHLYQFEVSAINKEGQSEPIYTGDPILAENPYRPPSQPGEPQITDFDNKSVTLKWEKPKDNGGRPITHYIIQKKDKFGGWFDALVTDDKNCSATIDDLEARVPGLSEGKWYQFRVIAVNKAGESEPSPHTKPHLCRHKNLSPSIDKGQAGSKTVKTNRTAIWQIKCKGEPPPEFVWTHPKEGLMRTCEQWTILHDEYQGGSTTTLVINRAKMSDAGTYTLEAINRNGKEKVDLDLIVLDTLPECECNMYKKGDKMCSCMHSYTGPELNYSDLALFLVMEYPS